MLSRSKSMVGGMMRGASTVSKEERRREIASIMIQNAYRARLARRKAQDYFRAKYRKVYHNELKRYVFQHKKTEEILIRLPRYFKYQDYPAPRDYEAPFEYDAGQDLTGEGYALFITTTQFKLGKWPEMDEKQLLAIDDDHDHLVDLLSHEFYGKLRSENIIAMKNPTLEECQDMFKRMRRQCRRSGFLVVYIATHVVTVKKGDPKDKQENTYFALRSTIWTTPNEIVESAISLKAMSKMINSIQCKAKTVFVNYAHLPAPRKVMFSAPKHIYPPSDFVQRLANACRCPIIAPCAIGFSVKDYLKGHPGIQFDNGIMKRDGKVINVPKPGAKTLEQQPHIRILFNASAGNEPKPSLTEAEAAKKKASRAVYDHPLWLQLLQDWNIPPPKDVYRTPAPQKLDATWMKNPENEFKLEVELPNLEQRRDYKKNYLFWKLKTDLAKPINAFKEGVIQTKKAALIAPEQTSRYKDGHTFFGKAILEAIKGAISEPGRDLNRVRDLFPYMYRRVLEEIDLLNQAAPTPTSTEEDASKEKEKDKNKGKDKSKDEGKPEEGAEPAVIEKITQTPVLYLPVGGEDMLDYPLFYRCGPPPAPEQPFILKVDTHAVTIEWFNPRFEGDPAARYKVLMRNVTKNFNQWSEVYYPGDIMKTKFTVRDLPMGIACQFKVAAANRGGWGAESPDTVYVTPGENQNVLPDSLRWRRLHEAGIFGVMDRMELYPKHRKEQYFGCRMVLGWASNGHGFKKNKVALKVAAHMMEILATYTHDPELIVLAINIIGWCLQGKTERKVRSLMNQKNLNEIVTERMLRFRYHTGIINSIQWLRTGNMGKYITEIPEYKYRIMFPTEPEEFESSDEEEEGQPDPSKAEPSTQKATASAK